jgi:hypothetical protein
MSLFGGGIQVRKVISKLKCWCNLGNQYNDGKRDKCCSWTCEDMTILSMFISRQHLCSHC